MRISRKRHASGPVAVVGLGALNVDLIVVGQGLGSRGDVDAAGDGETAAGGGAADELLRRLAGQGIWPDGFLGGSAFNAVTMLGQLKRGLRLGMVGISAPASYGLRESHADRLRALGIKDLTAPATAPGKPGLCLAFADERHRRLRTSPAANVEIAEYLLSARAPHVEVAAAKVLHLTSLLEDPRLPGSTWVAKSVASFAASVKELNPRLLLSFDPGAPWVDGLADLPELRPLYRLADVVFLNAEERAALAERGSLAELCAPRATVVEKSPDQVVVRSCDGSRAEVVRRPATELGTVDPTGAGDAVAAGVLAALGEGRSVADGCRLGLRIAAQRVRDVGDRGHANLRRSLGRIWR